MQKIFKIILWLYFVWKKKLYCIFRHNNNDNDIKPIKMILCIYLLQSFLFIILFLCKILTRNLLHLAFKLRNCFLRSEITFFVILLNIKKNIILLWLISLIYKICFNKNIIESVFPYFLFQGYVSTK